jgi:DNA mismatch repair ATPase MutL
VPIVAELAPRQQVILEQIAEELSANGFEVTPMGGHSVAIQAAPAAIRLATASGKILTRLIPTPNSYFSGSALIATCRSSSWL